jgi:ATP-dependent RNA helicase DDX35
VQRKRKDLRVIISSATVDAEEFREFFTAPTNSVNPKLTESVSILSIEGRQYPVEIFYSKTPVTDYLQSAYNTVTEIHRREPAGDILVFLTGQVRMHREQIAFNNANPILQEEIDTLVKLLKERDQSGTSLNPNMTMQVLPLYAGLSNDQQMRVFKATPQSTRKVVVATNIAETSVTIEGVVYVIDCGFVKVREQHIVVPASKRVLIRT